MKIQNAFISSSSSSSHVTYSTSTTPTTYTFKGYSDYHNILTNSSRAEFEANPSNKSLGLTTTTTENSVIWSTHESTSYQRIEYFLEAIEKMNSPYYRKNKTFIPMTEYSSHVAKKDIYNGFVDIVITFPCKIRIAGLEFINPWNGKLPTDEEYNYWRYLPKKFSIFKVDDEQVNDNFDRITYRRDIARIARCKWIR
jgi:hypothetical protein